MEKFYLLTDDDHDDGDLFQEALSGISPPVGFHYAENCHKLFHYLDHAENRRPDIIFLDLNMPEISGWECLVKLKDHPEHQHIPVIMYSTSSAMRDHSIALQLGALGLLTKPPDFNVLTEMLSRISETPAGDLTRALEEIRAENGTTTYVRKR